MSPEFWAIIGVGVTLGLGLGSLMIAQHSGINSRLDSVHAELFNIGQRVAYIEGRLTIHAASQDTP